MNSTPPTRTRRAALELGLHLLERRPGRWLGDEVVELVRVGLQVVELVHAAELCVMDIFPAIGAHRLVGHLPEPREDDVGGGEVLDEERRPGRPRPSREQADERAAVQTLGDAQRRRARAEWEQRRG